MSIGLRLQELSGQHGVDLNCRAAVWECSRMARWLDEEQATVDAGILDITITLGRKFLSEVR